VNDGHDTSKLSSSPPALSRRRLLFGSATAFGGLALCGLLWRERHTPSSNPRTGARGAYQGPFMEPRAKRVIFLYMGGGPSQMDTFDPKPLLTKHNGKEYAPPEGGHPGTLMKSPFRFAKHMESGAEVSELFPHLATCIDHLTIVRSMVTDYEQHPTANYFLHSGSPRSGHPSVGSWITYGLGSETEDLPAYVVLNSGVVPEGGMLAYGNAYLPAKFQPTVLGLESPAIANLKPRESAESVQRSKLNLIEALNRQSGHGFTDDRLEAVIVNYELAFRMQSSVPGLLDLGNETQATLDLYGISSPETKSYGEQCLRARKLIENGVRFVELLPNHLPGANVWDQHSNLAVDLRANAAAVDKPTAGLLKDLSARGLLDDTLVLWGGEFGRTPTAEGSGATAGRNHSAHGFTMWLAGARMLAGLTYGATDDYGDYVIDKKVHVHDLQATILHLLGIDHQKLTYRYSGRDFRLTDVEGEVVHGLLA
jgi:hypothetical protein